jgi:Ca2+-binding EF-hand superfamily protein
MWSRRRAFEQIDWLARGHVTSSEILQALESLGDPGLSIGKNDVDSIVRRFNKNKVHNRITLKEFIDEVTPKVPSKSF